METGEKSALKFQPGSPLHKMGYKPMLFDRQPGQTMRSAPAELIGEFMKNRNSP